MDPKDRTSPESDRLHAPAEGGAADLAAELLAKLVSPTSVDEKGRTALHIACELGQLETVQLLINHGASVAVRDHAGNTPLMYAATSGNSVLIELLLELGADIHARNRRGQDALVLASISDHADAARLLRERLLAMRGLAAKTAASAAGTHFSEIPDKKGVFIGGVTRGNGEQSRTEPTTEEKQALAEEMNRSIPLTTFSGWLKQVNVDELNPMGLLALDYGFPHFLNFLDFTEDQAHNALTRRGYGVTEFVNPGRARRFAGDHTLPRGRITPFARMRAVTTATRSRGNSGPTIGRNTRATSRCWTRRTKRCCSKLRSPASGNCRGFRRRTSALFSLPRERGLPTRLDGWPELISPML